MKIDLRASAGTAYIFRKMTRKVFSNVANYLVSGYSGSSRRVLPLPLYFTKPALSGIGRKLLREKAVVLIIVVTLLNHLYSDLIIASITEALKVSNSHGSRLRLRYVNN
jgi:hypothetical protein